jgi:uncharacterized membrane-anchored protein
MNKRNLIISLIFPIIVLIGLIAYKQAKVMAGMKITLPITGFDPRDLLSGHYLIYRIDYGVKDDDYCYDYKNNGQDAYVCLQKESDDPEAYSSQIFAGNNNDNPDYRPCFAVIKGKCKNGRFTAGIEKFFIPEEYAAPLDSAVRGRKGKIVLSVSKNGSAAIKDLLIDDKSWRDYKEIKE